jgi:hypothetical protein
MITRPKVKAIPTFPSAPVFSSTMMAPAPAKTSANVPIASARSARASGGTVNGLARGRAVVGFVRGAERVLELVDELACRGERFLLDRVVDPGSLAAGRHQPGAAERPEMLRDPRLAVGQVVLQVADAERSARRDLGEKLKTDRVGERLENFHGEVPRLGDDPRLRDRP